VLAPWDASYSRTFTFLHHPDANRQISITVTPLMIRVVTFDAAGTLIRLLHPPGQVYSEIALQFGFQLDPVRVQNAFKMVWSSFPPPAQSDGPCPDDDRGWWRDLVAKIITEAGYRIDPFDRYFETVYAHFALPGVWELFQDVPGILCELGRLGIRLGVISNFDRRLYDILTHLNVRHLFEHLIVSSEIGIRKPAARIFEVAVRRFGTTAGEIMHVGDEPESDFAGARRAGLQALLVNHERINLSELIDCLSRFAQPKRI
jgi:putative hydrolase of the HAD superfamily